MQREKLRERVALLDAETKDLARMTLAEALEAEINRRGMTQAAAADEIGVKQQALSRWIRGTARPQPQYLDQLAVFLRMTPKKVRETWATSTSSASSIEKRVTALEAEIDELRRAVTRLVALLDAP